MRFTSPILLLSLMSYNLLHGVKLLNKGLTYEARDCDVLVRIGIVKTLNKHTPQN